MCFQDALHVLNEKGKYLLRCSLFLVKLQLHYTIYISATQQRERQERRRRKMENETRNLLMLALLSKQIENVAISNFTTVGNCTERIAKKRNNQNRKSIQKKKQTTAKRLGRQFLV